MKNRTPQHLVVLALILTALTAWATLPNYVRKAAAERTAHPSQPPHPLGQRATNAAQVGLRNIQVLPTAYIGAAALQSALRQDSAHPLALAAGDFDEDGVPDLVVGYSATGSGLLTFQRGNVDALFPNSLVARQRKASGRFTDAPFLNSAQVLALPESPEFVATGDFNADGHVDIVTAARESQSLYLLAGDGRGDFNSPESINLPGGVTALASGEINRADGLMDLAVGIARSEGPRVLVFESPDGALRGAPESFDLPIEATALAIGRLDEDAMNDLAVAAGRDLLTLKGRDRRLSLDDTRRAEVRPATVNQRNFPATITAVAIGDFAPQSKLALLFADGAVQLLGRESDGIAKGSRSETEQWQAREILRVSRPGGSSLNSFLVCARISTHPGQDLVVADSDRLRIVAGGLEVSAAAIESADAPVAVLPMQLNGDALSDLVIFRSGQSAPTLALSAPAAIFTVTNASDSGPGSLRDAVNQANSTAGADMITFAIGSGLQTITPLSPLPVITEAVTIDGTTQPGFAGAPLVELRGTSAGPNTRGLEIGATNCTIKALVINGFSKSGIFIGGAGASGNNVQGCYIGTNAAGTAAIPNGTSGNSFDTDGVDIFSGAHDNIIGGTTVAARNVISGNSDDGVFIFLPGTNNNLVQGNYIGTNAAGTAAIANNFAGVEIATTAAPGPQGNIIGGTAAGAGNVVSGNGQVGVGVFNADSNNNLVQGNFVGTNAAGTGAVPNGFQGVVIANPPGGPTSAKNNLIGGTVASARNVISGNANNGVQISHSGTNNNLVQGNYIGTNAAGTAAVPNGFVDFFHGVEISFGAQLNTIGGTVTGARNLISGNAFAGVGIFNPGTNNNSVQGNLIGTQVDGVSPLGNAFYGVWLRNSPGTNNTIGGTTGGAGSTIAFNGQAGVLVDSGIANPIRGNSIFSNTGLGIDILPFGVTANDNCDGDFGPNNLQNFPVLTSATSAASTMIQGTLNSTANTTFTLEFFANPACDSSGNGEGMTFIGSMPVTTNASCTASFNFTFPTSAPGGQFVTATATDPAGNTSEFSACTQVVPQCTFSIAPANQTFTASGGADMVAVTASSGCNWTAVSNDSFITITSGGGGVGNGTVNYSVDLNNNPSSRIGTMTIAGQTFTVTQTGCQFSISPTNQTFTASGGSDMVTVTAPGGCSWMAVSNDPGFITITSGSGGVGNGAVSYTVDPNPTVNPRIGTMTIAGQTFTVNQSGMTCAGLISPTSASFSTIGGTGSVMVPAPIGCNWMAASNDAWITITSGSSGTGDGTVGYSVAANPGATRTGTMTIASQTFTVTQTGGLMFFPLPAPVRLLDTRFGGTACTTSGVPITGNTVLTQLARGTCGIPASAKVVTGNVTTVNSGTGFLTLYPSDVTRPVATNTNYMTGEVLNNVFTVGLSAVNGSFDIYALTTTDVVVDITGYYAPPAAGGLYFHTLPKPIRLLETRFAQTGCYTPGIPMLGGVDFIQQGTTTCDGVTIPVTAKALVGNASTFMPAGMGFLTLYPADVAMRPLAASGNYKPDLVRNSPFTVGLSPSGQFKIFTTQQTDLVIDVLGYFSSEVLDENGTGLLFNSLTPVRLLDTRVGATAACFTPGAALIGGMESLQPASNVCTIASTAKAIVGNATTVQPAANGFLTFWPSDVATRPLAATSNFQSGRNLNRYFTVGLGADGGFKMFSSQTTNLVIDVSGYFAP